jgi:hypothetical protein
MALSRRGNGRTANPRVYVGCLPCAQGRWAADLERANIWITTHWRRGSSFDSGLGGADKASDALKEAG